MYTLGIETSCDETAAAVIKDGRRIASNVVSSSLQLHKKYGGIIPEIASRMQMETITSVVNLAIKEARIKLNDLKLIAVTSGPGLLGSLVVGLEFAKALSLSQNTPILGINHLHSHIYANFFNKEVPDFPFIALVVSGGHTSLFLLKDFDKIKILGATSDDACGEAFDKVAKILGLGYPGGPIIEKLAVSGNAKKIKFSCSNPSKPLDFSFSGIKTAVLYYVKKHGIKDKNIINDISACFQETVVNTLIEKSFLACRINKIKRLVISGGVASNSYLRNSFLESNKKTENFKIFFPAKQLCTDNAAMVGGLGYQLFKKGYSSDLYLNLMPN